MGYAIDKVLNQLIFNQMISDQSNLAPKYYLVVYFLRKTISAKTWYKTQNNKLLTIIKVFKACCHYLNDCKDKILVMTNHNNLSQFMDIKNLRFY